MTEQEPLTYTVEQVARLIGVSRGSCFEAVRRGEIPSIRIGRRVLVPRARLLAMLGEEPLGSRVEG